MNFSDNLKQAIGSVSQEVACELEDAGSESSNRSIVTEVTLDAGRLKTFGHPNAYKELRQLIDEFGWQKVSEEAQKYVSTW